MSSIKTLTIISFLVKSPLSVFAALLTVDWTKISGSIEWTLAILEREIIKKVRKDNIFFVNIFTPTA